MYRPTQVFLICILSVIVLFYVGFLLFIIFCPNLVDFVRRIPVLKSQLSEQQSAKYESKYHCR